MVKADVIIEKYGTLAPHDCVQLFKQKHVSKTIDCNTQKKKTIDCNT